MRPIAATNLVPRQRGGILTGGSNVAAAVLKTTSCSVMRTGAEVPWVWLTEVEVGATSGAAGLDSKCIIRGCLRYLMALAVVTTFRCLKDKHQSALTTSYKRMRSGASHDFLWDTFTARKALDAGTNR
jgi:hypothetical protein